MADLQLHLAGIIFSFIRIVTPCGDSTIVFDEFKRFFCESTLSALVPSSTSQSMSSCSDREINFPVFIYAFHRPATSCIKSVVSVVCSLLMCKVGNCVALRDAFHLLTTYSHCTLPEGWSSEGKGVTEIGNWKHGIGNFIQTLISY